LDSGITLKAQTRSVITKEEGLFQVYSIHGILRNRR